MNEYLIEAYWDRRSKWPCSKWLFTDKNKSRGGEGGGCTLESVALPSQREYITHKKNKKKTQNKTTAPPMNLLNFPRRPSSTRALTSDWHVQVQISDRWPGRQLRGPQVNSIFSEQTDAFLSSLGGEKSPAVTFRGGSLRTLTAGSRLLQALSLSA